MGGLLGIEFSILDVIADTVRCGFLDVVMPVISRIGDNGYIWIALALVLLCVPKERSRGVQILVAIALSAIVVNLCLKHWVGRIRPFDVITGIELIIEAPLDFSFPSGHTSASFAAAMVLLLTKWRWRYLALVLAVLIAFSRLYLYVHFPSDVLCGALIGLLLGFCAVKLYPHLCRIYGRMRKGGAARD